MLLTTKSFIPINDRPLVDRAHLLAKLDAGLNSRVTLVAAPAGFGKTTLISAWSAQFRAQNETSSAASPPATGRRHFCWLTLDANDNDPIRFLNYVVGALQTADANLGTGLQIMLQAFPAPPLGTVLTSLLNDIESSSTLIVLVLDDYHLITVQPIHEALTFLIENLPPTLHLVISTRADPPLPLARWRVRNQLTEIRASDLRFRLEEATAFLERVMGLVLSTQEIATLEERTEGWIAALQLAALSMQGRHDLAGFISAFTGSHRFIIDYLSEEVLNHQSESVREFLISTSILDRICGSLGDALTQSTTGQATLEYLEQSNLFLIPLDDERRWYRYHHLFADVLQQVQPQNVTDLHRRACKWLAQHGLNHEAVDHALAGRDFDEAARLIEQVYSVKWQSGEIRTLQSWLAALPPEYWRRHPHLWLIQSWAAMTVGNFSDADEKLKKAEEALARMEGESARNLRPEVLAFRACYASLVQDTHAVALAQEALHNLPEDYWLRGMLVVFLGAAYYAAGDLDAAAHVLGRTSDATLATLEAQPHLVHVLALRGTVQLAKGKLREAKLLLDQALKLAEPNGNPIPYVGTYFTYMSVSLVLYELDETEATEMYLTRCESQAAKFGSTEVQIFALSGLARLHLACDDWAAAAKCYDQIDALLQTHTLNTSIMAYVDYHRFLLWLKQKNLVAAATWVERHAEHAQPLSPNAFHRLALPQILIAYGKIDQALDQLTLLIQEAQNSGHGSFLIKALVLQAVAFDASSKRSDALRAIERALTLAEPEGFIRPFVDHGEPIRTLIHDFGITIINLALAQFAHRVLAALDRRIATSVERATSLPSATPQMPTIAQPQAQTKFLVEPLSARELEILCLVADGLSNTAIAATLIVTVGTVKKHLNNIYGKLGVGSRTQAIARARELGLL